MNEVLQAIEKRYSCRTYTGKTPSQEQLDAIAKAANQCPSSINRQRWQIVVLKDKALMAELEAEALQVMAAMEDQSMYQRIMERGGKLFYGAPCAIYVPIDSADPAGCALDCGIVCQTIALAAHSLGLASCICGLARLSFSPQKAETFKQKLQFPKGYEFGMAVLLGEGATSGEPHQPNPEKISFIG